MEDQDAVFTRIRQHFERVNDILDDRLASISDELDESQDLEALLVLQAQNIEELQVVQHEQDLLQKEWREGQRDPEKRKLIREISGNCLEKLSFYSDKCMKLHHEVKILLAERGKELQDVRRGRSDVNKYRPGDGGDGAGGGWNA